MATAVLSAIITIVLSPSGEYTECTRLQMWTSLALALRHCNLQPVSHAQRSTLIDGVLLSFATCMHSVGHHLVLDGPGQGQELS